MVLVALCRGDVSLQQVQKVYTGKEENVVSECSRIHSATELRLEQSVTSFQRTSPNLTEPELYDKNEIPMSRYLTKH